MKTKCWKIESTIALMMSVLTCLLYVSSWLRAALAFLSSSSRLTVFCMYIVFFSSKSFTCRRKSPRSSNFFLYDSTWLSNLATLSEECLKGQICIKFKLWKLTKLKEFKMLLHCFFLMQKTLRHHGESNGAIISSCYWCFHFKIDCFLPITICQL